MFIVKPIVLGYPQMLRNTQKAPFSSVLCQVGFFPTTSEISLGCTCRKDLGRSVSTTGTSSPWQWRQWKLPVDELSKDYRRWALKLSDDISLIGWSLQIMFETSISVGENTLKLPLIFNFLTQPKGPEPWTVFDTAGWFAKLFGSPGHYPNQPTPPSQNVVIWRP